jgi:hypothetical protein
LGLEGVIIVGGINLFWRREIESYEFLACEIGHIIDPHCPTLWFDSLMAELNQTFVILIDPVSIERLFLRAILAVGLQRK